MPDDKPVTIEDVAPFLDTSSESSLSNIRSTASDKSSSGPPDKPWLVMGGVVRDITVSFFTCPNSQARQARNSLFEVLYR